MGVNKSGCSLFIGFPSRIRLYFFNMAVDGKKNGFSIKLFFKENMIFLCLISSGN